MKESTRSAYVFPGQGSQWVGMGSNLYKSSPVAKKVFDEADEVLGFPLSRLCFEGPEDELKRTVNAQPAVLTLSLAYLKTALAEGRMNGEALPEMVAGHSLGEYTALVAGGVIDFSQAVQLVRERGRLMNKAGNKRKGGMAAVIGLNREALQEVCEQSGAYVANINSAEQIVISGNKKSLEKATELAKSAGARRAIPLPVSGAFHCEMMEPALKGMTEFINEMEFQEPKMPLIANTTATPLTTSAEIKAELINQLCNCVDWQGCIKYMADAGINTFVEIGPGQVLTGLIRRITPEAETVNIGEPQPGVYVLSWRPPAPKTKRATIKARQRAWGYLIG